MLSIAGVLARATCLYPEKLALCDGDTRLTYRQLGERVNALAAAFAALGINRGERIAVLDVNSHRNLEIHYAASQTGAILVPLNIRLTSGELRHILKDAGVRVFFASGVFDRVLGDIDLSDTPVEKLVLFANSEIKTALDYESLIGAASSREPIEPDMDEICHIYYTSGTTGMPKGVCLSYGNMTASMLDFVVGLSLTPRDVFLHAAPMFHLADSWAIWTTPLLGGTQVTVHFDPEHMLQAAERSRASVVVLPPTLLGLVVDHPRFADYDLSGLRLVMFGGSPMPLGLLRRATSALSCAFVHAYGTTETSGAITLQQPEEVLTKAGSAGHVAAHIETRIVDANGLPLPAHQVGEVLVRGERVMSGYWNNPAASADALQEGWYHTGDLGYFDAEQSLYIVDRKKDMIITGAENVYSVEIEDILSTHADVLEVAVIGVPSDQWGEAVLAIVVVRPGATISEADLIGFCRGKIAGYKIPKRIEFYSTPLPRTSTGKIAKRLLRDRYWADRQQRI